MKESEFSPDGTGLRLRQARLQAGLSQAGLAAKAEISPAYLNLIEHGRRPVAGGLLHRLARLLGADPAALSRGVPPHVRSRLAALAAETPDPALAEPEALAARFPGWASLIATQADKITTLEQRLEGLSDRMAHDPALAASLHDLISAVTSIRATAAILEDAPELDADWRGRFLGNIREESLRLAEQAQQVVTQLAPPDTTAPGSPFEQVFAAQDYHLAGLETAQTDQTAGIDAELARHPRPIRAALAPWFARYWADAQALPLDQFAERAQDLAHDPFALAQALGAPLARVLRRLATLPVAAGHPQTGLAICDAGGAVLLRKPLEAEIIPRDGTACPLWPLFEALTRPGHPVERRLIAPGGTVLDAVAIAETALGAGPDRPVRTEAVMLLRVAPTAPDQPAPPLRIGPGCLFCPQPDCGARRAPPRVPFDS